MNPIRLEIEKIHTSIDKIAKKGKDSYVDYYSLIDELINKRKFDLFKQTLLIKYNIETNDRSVFDIKRETWKEVRFQTNTSLQDEKQKLLKNNNIYQLGLIYYKEIPQTRILISDPTGINGALSPIVASGSLSSIQIINVGKGYSATSSVVTVIGGLMPATASVTVRAGRIYSTSVSNGGSYHNQDIKLGSIKEVSIYEEIISDGTVSNDNYQKFTSNKTTKLEVTLNNSYSTVTFETWNYDKSYDKNVLLLYEEAIEYLLTTLESL